jgi:hypothetical protein
MILETSTRCKQLTTGGTLFTSKVGRTCKKLRGSYISSRPNDDNHDRLVKAGNANQDNRVDSSDFGLTGNYLLSP